MMQTREEVERARQRADRKKETSIIGIGGAILLILIAVGIYLFVTARPDAVPPPAGAAPVAASNAVMSDSNQCERLIEIARRNGIVKGMRVGNRIRVDEKHWAAITDEARGNLMQYLACATFAGRSLDALDEGETVIAVNAATGKLIARAGRSGIMPLPTRSSAGAGARTAP